MIGRTVRFMLAASVLVLALPAALQAQATVKLTKHNLSAGSRTASPAITGTQVADYGEVCVYCHTPHSGSAAIPLWNRASTGATYTMYTSTNSATMNMTVGAAPGPVSLACASCHDGTVGLDVITNKPNASTATPVTPAALMGTVFSGTKAVLGSELRDDHPIAVTYNPLLDTDFVAKATVETSLRLYGASKDQVECGSCHNPHNNTNAPFLRKSNAASALCLTCHIK
ncbi:MAG: cytochrome c3 family protein [Gemmatimonadaceae bacterium]